MYFRKIFQFLLMRKILSFWVSFEIYEIALCLGKRKVQFLFLICYKKDVSYKLYYICFMLAIRCPAIKYHFTVYRETVTYKSYLSVEVLYNLVLIFISGRDKKQLKRRWLMVYSVKSYCTCQIHWLQVLEILVFKTKDGNCYYSWNRYMAYYLVMSRYLSREIK